MDHIYAVSEVNGLIKDLIDGTPQLSGLYIRGELSNYKIYPSGHHYFTLKDGQSALRCVMFKSSAMKLRFRPENGMQAVVFGRISVFPRDGAYQLYCTQLSPDGVGDLYVAFEQLKAKLYELEMRKRMEEQTKLEESKSDIGWGHQIRSYVLDQSRVKDLRTNVETGNTGAVLDGDLDQFIEASLKNGVAAA